MNYIKLFEAFEGDIISKVSKYLIKSLNKESSIEFINSLKSIMNQYDIPIDKISNENLKYSKTSQAVDIKSDTNVENTTGTYCIKFWFSLKDGFLGTTGTGNFKTPFYKDSKSGIFNNTEMQYIKNMGFETGTLFPVLDYNTLKTGDKVFLYPSRDKYVSNLVYATIWKRYNLYAIFSNSNITGGDSPDSYDEQDVDGTSVTWRSLGNKSWNLGNPNTPSSDHKSVHLYIKDDKSLSVYGGNEGEDNSLRFNLPFDRNGELCGWNSGVSIGGYEKISQSDFCIILYLDDVLKLKRNISPIRRKRVEEKKGSYGLLNNEEIKRINIEKYLNIIISKMGIEKEAIEFNNLQKVVLSQLCGKFSIISVYTNKPRSENLSLFIDRLTNFIQSNTDYKQDYIDKVKRLYINMKDERSTFISLYEKSLKQVKGGSIKEFLDELLKAGDILEKYFKSNTIDTIEDLTISYYKLRHIREIMNHEHFTFSSEARNLISEFRYEYSALTYSDRYKNLNFDEDIRKVKLIEKYIKSMGNYTHNPNDF